MGGEHNGTQVQDTQQQEDDQRQKAPQAQGGPEPEGAVTPQAAAPGIDPGKYEQRLAKRDQRIVELEAQVAEAARNAETVEGLRAEIAALRQQGRTGG